MEIFVECVKERGVKYSKKIAKMNTTQKKKTWLTKRDIAETNGGRDETDWLHLEHDRSCRKGKTL